jgi:hypothetical protein
MSFPQTKQHMLLFAQGIVMNKRNKGLYVAAIVIAIFTSNAQALFDSSESLARAAVLKALKDPDSAKFGKFTQVGNYACLTVNARNSLGGYTGDQQAILVKITDEWRVAGIEKVAHSSCVEAIKRR